MPDTAELVKEKLDIAEFIRGYVVLSSAGKNLKGLCPFHKEKTPSFIVSPERDSWHCFGCNIGGDVIAFLMRYENLEFLEALRILAEKAGVEMRGRAPEERQYGVLYEINHAACEFFRNALAAETAVGGVARNYLDERGLKQEIINEFEIGFAPNASDALSRHLSKAGFKIQDVERAGLVFKTERGTFWDRFRGRIMFPLHNHFGKVVGFTGRVLPHEDPESGEGPSNAKAVSAETTLAKYVNSPETPLFSKSKLLFGYWKSKSAIREAKAAVMVEGQMDFLMSYQDGVKNVIATSGTALTSDHLKQLKRSADTIIIAFDTDEAGQAATERVIDLAGAADFTVKIVNQKSLGKEAMKDPADIVKESPGTMAQLVAAAEPAMRHYFDRYLVPLFAVRNVEVNQDMASIKRSVRMVLSKIKLLASPVEQAHWVREVGSVTGVSEPHLFAELEALRNQKKENAALHELQSVPDETIFSRRDLIAQRLCSLGIADTALRAEIVNQTSFFHAPYARLLAALFQDEGKGAPPELATLADLVRLRSSFEMTDPKAMKEEAGELIRTLKREFYRDQQGVVRRAIQRAEKEGDETRLAESLREFDRIAKEIYNA